MEETINVTLTEETIVAEPGLTVVGPKGLSAYQVAVTNGFVGTEAEWLASLVAEGGGSGDMLVATYDPNAVGGDAFDMGNMVESAAAKVLTAAERSAIAANSAKVSNVLTSTEIAAATAKATPVDADTLGLSDSAAAGVLKKLSWANLKATLKAYFDGLYLAISGGTIDNYSEATSSTITSGNVTLSSKPLQRYILDASRQFTMPADPGAVGKSIVVIIECATFTPTWNSLPTIEWLTSDGAAPTLVTAANLVNVLTFIWDDVDSRWLGFLAGKETA